MGKTIKTIVLGVSAGGFKALHTLLPLFPASFEIPVLIVQHRVPAKDNYFVESLDKACAITVKEADDKEPVKLSTAYLAPGGYHLLLEKDMTLALSVDEPVSYARPSIDVLFETAAYACKEELIGVILTGSNSDGSSGIKLIRQLGGVTIAQKPETAESPVMPKAAIETGSIDHIMTIEEIPQFIITLVE